MKHIKLEELAKILDAGLKEEVQLTGRISANYRSGPEYIGFSYSGNVSIKTVDPENRIYNITPTNATPNHDLAQLSFSTRNRMEIDLGSDNQRNPVEPYIKIPIGDDDKSSIRIEGIKDIKY